MRKEFKYYTDGIKDGTIMETVTSYPWNTQFNSYMTPEEGEKNELPSVTEPNQALKLSDLLKRHTSGRRLDDYIRPGGFYEVQPEANTEVFDTFQAGIPDLSRLDFAERQELAVKTKLYTEALKEVRTRKEAEKGLKPNKIVDAQGNDVTPSTAPSAGASVSPKGDTLQP